MSQFGLQGHLDTIYETTERQFTFDASDSASARAWQIVFRAALLECLKIDRRIMPDIITTEYLSTTDKGSYSEDKYTLQNGDVAVPMYLLIPKADPPYRPMIVFHGHGMGVNLILGHYDNSPDAQTYTANGENFAQRLAEDGYLVCAIEQQGFGERRADPSYVPDSNNSCRQLAFHYLLHDRTLLGERVWEGMLAISYLLTRDDILSNELACVGFSGGGTTALFLSALDERIRKSVIMGYLCTMQKSILGVSHCECNYVPNLLTLGETGDIAGLIAPRPVLVSSGEADLIFPVDGVREQYAVMENVYHVMGAEDRCQLSIHDGGHRPDYEAMQRWLTQVG